MKRWIMLGFMLWGMHLIHAQKKVEVNRFGPKRSIVYALSFSSDGRYLAFPVRNTIEIWDVDQHARTQVLASPSESLLTSVSFIPNSAQIVAGDKTGNLFLWDVQSEQLRFQVQAHEDAVSNLAITRTDNMILTASYDGTVKSLDISGKNLKTFFDFRSPVVGLDLHPNDSLLAIGGAERTIVIINVFTGLGDNRLAEHKNWIRGLKFRPDGKEIVSCGDDSNLYFWNVKEKRPPRNVSVKGMVGWLTGLSYNQGGALMACCGHNYRVVILGNAGYYYYQTKKFSNAVSFRPKTNQIAVATYGDGVILFDVKDLELTPYPSSEPSSDER